MSPAPASNIRGMPILAIATEWGSHNGGLSTLNRNLCIALARAGHRVACLVAEASREDFDAAKKLGVDLIQARPMRGKDVGPLACLSRRPDLPNGFTPELIIGHGRVTGYAARVLAGDYFSDALRIHFLHTVPSEIEWYKPRSTDASVRAEGNEGDEMDLGRTAALAVGVGPRLAAELTSLLAPYSPPRRVHQLDPGLDRLVGASPAVARHRAPPPGLRCLFLGRAEDEELKGLDIAAEAIARVRERGIQAVLVVRGAAPGTGQKLQVDLSARVKALNSVQVKDFSANQDAIRDDLLRSTVILMPSRSEGFGLVGIEAIEHGVPALLSNQSGLAQLLCRRDLPDVVARVVVPVTTDLPATADTWARRIETELHDPAAAFARAAQIRDALMPIFTWEAAADSLIKAIREV